MGGKEDEGLASTLGVSKRWLRVSDSLMKKSMTTLRQKREEKVKMVRHIKQIQKEGAETMLRFMDTR